MFNGASVKTKSHFTFWSRCAPLVYMDPKLLLIYYSAKRIKQPSIRCSDVRLIKHNCNKSSKCRSFFSINLCSINAIVLEIPIVSMLLSHYSTLTVTNTKHLSTFSIKKSLTPSPTNFVHIVLYGQTFASDCDTADGVHH